VTKWFYKDDHVAVWLIQHIQNVVQGMCVCVGVHVCACVCLDVCMFVCLDVCGCLCVCW
jgi:hypothetical protein